MTTLEDLNKLLDDAEKHDGTARRIDACRAHLAKVRADGDFAVPRLLITGSRYGVDAEAEAELANDFTRDIFASILRITEMRLEREARCHRNQAKLARAAITAAIGDDE